MDGLNIQMSFENLKISLKDVLQIVSFVVVAAFFFSAQSSKIEAVAAAVKEIKSDTKESRSEDKIGLQQLINQVNTNSVNIKLLEQRMDQMESKK